ncbi:Hypothetical predicted protein [Pelobates cultripes]|uniref:Uncharacterized protein n=1 Tax=Pelobates cultripes TaxID=61616 RepID=A0AAD1SXA4_PELCU|nr:Hypothetical predicted protein [Pelobates cultripes]
MEAETSRIASPPMAWYTCALLYNWATDQQEKSPYIPLTSAYGTYPVRLADARRKQVLYASQRKWCEAAGLDCAPVLCRGEADKQVERIVVLDADVRTSGCSTKERLDVQSILQCTRKCPFTYGLVRNVSRQH